MINNEYSNTSSLAHKYRSKRHEYFKGFLKKVALIENKESLNILDIGGTVEYWKVFNYKELPHHITLVNLDSTGEILQGISLVQGDATDLKFDDQQFDVVFSNSVIEHVGDYQAQKRMAAESMRVARYFFIQTPNLYFPFEPHYRIIGFQFLPTSIKAILIQHFRLRQKRIRHEKLAWDKAITFAKSINLLTAKKLQSLYETSILIREKAFLFTKSFIIHSDI